MSDMTGKVCLVTGATDGHGRAVARQLARRGAEVVLHGRSAEKCRLLQQEIAAEASGRAPTVLLCDLASQAEINRATSEFIASGRPLHLLVNNAGLVSLRRQESVDHHELVFAVNYLAMFQFTLRLLPRLVESKPARIVNISSDAYRIAKLDLDDLALDPYSFSNAYARSKLAVLYFTIELARRIDGERVTVNAVDPGPIASNIGANNPGFLYSLARPMIRYLFPSADRAARTAMWVATDPALADASGGYFRSQKQRREPLEFDEKLSERLWRTSMKLTATDTKSLI